jgi:ribosomal protein S18 acetylase RimI-like enzyme
VYVTPEYRNQGVYKAMYTKVKEEARVNNVSQIRLYVDKTNLNAQKVYEKLGMTESHYLMYEKATDLQ